MGQQSADVGTRRPPSRHRQQQGEAPRETSSRRQRGRGDAPIARKVTNKLNRSEKKAIENKVQTWQAKQERIQRRRDRKKQRQKLLEQKESLFYKLSNCVVCKPAPEEESQEEADLEEIKKISQQTNGDEEHQQQVAKHYFLKHLLEQSNEQQQLIMRAKQLWKLVKKKIKVIRMMGQMGGEKVLQLKERRKVSDDEPSNHQQQISKFIINPNNYWNMWWNNFTQLVFIVWIFLTPNLISRESTLREANFRILLVFDVIFMIDRIMDLFVGFYTPNGFLEHRILKVIQQNISTKFFLEILIGFGPMAFLDITKLNSLYYTLFKIPRYSRLFEMDGQIAEILDYYGQFRTVFEIKQMERSLNILQFALQTCINLHIMTSTQIILCIHRDFSKSWMGGQGVKPDDFVDQYIIALYFVTTTLSTCGYGDISATTTEDSVEAACILFLQFVGMLFYSMTIQKVQFFMTNDELTASEYANFMVEVVENLIVKVGRQLPPNRQILSETISNWKANTLKYFQSSPNVFLIENEFYNILNCHMQVRIIKDFILRDFQDKFDIFFFDPECGYKADDKLISKVVASLSYEYLDRDDEDKDAIIENIIGLDVISSAIFFLFEGQLNMCYLENKEPLVVLDSGTYFGEISYLFQTKNKYNFVPRPGQNCKLYSLQDKYLVDIFDEFPAFKDLLLTRALRRQHYFRRLRHTQSTLKKIRKQLPRYLRHKQTNLIQNPQIFMELMKVKKTRLVEEKISYEELALKNNFSDDEVTFEHSVQQNSEKKNKRNLKRIHQVENHIRQLKQATTDSLGSVLSTLTQIDENTQKIALKRFEGRQINVLAKEFPKLQKRLRELSASALNNPQPGDSTLDTDQYDSDFDGNESDGDDMNTIEKYRGQFKKTWEEGMSKDVSPNSVSDSMKHSMKDESLAGPISSSSYSGSISEEDLNEEPGESLKKRK